MRLRRSELDQPGYRRRRCGRGFVFVDPAGHPVKDPEMLARLRATGHPARLA